MKRKLPPDAEVWVLLDAGKSQAQVADQFGCSRDRVGVAVARRANRVTKDDRVRASNKASTPDHTFVSVKSLPVAHRDTGEGALAIRLDEHGVFKPSPLELHECSDLLREWGVE